MIFTFTSSYTRRRFGVSAGHQNYKWWALSCTSLGMLLAATNSGTLIIALPDLERSLHASLLGLVWVILAYLIAATVLVLTAGRLSDLFGRKRAYVGGFVVFALASLGAGFSPDATVLILWRILQGIGSAFLFARSRGGMSTWENIVCSCHHCNRRKGGRTPDEAGMHLFRRPRRPEWTPFSSEMFSLRRYREWMPYLSQVDSAYWNTELIQD